VFRRQDARKAQNPKGIRDMTNHPPIGTTIGYVPAGETLAGWTMVATGDGRYIVTKSGACFGRDHDRSIPTDLAWDAVGAHFAAKVA
jgi:hypothetical protein